MVDELENPSALEDLEVKEKFKSEIKFLSPELVGEVSFKWGTADDGKTFYQKKEEGIFFKMTGSGVRMYVSFECMAMFKSWLNNENNAEILRKYLAKERKSKEGVDF